jgi:aldose sugar dehydrogenase
LFVHQSFRLIIAMGLVSFIQSYNNSFGQEEEEATIPQLKDSNLDIELVSNGLESPTSMAFLGPDDILVLEKDKGTVQRIVNGEMLDEPLLDVNVNSEDERGLLGIAVSKNASTDKTYVFLFYTEAEGTEDGGEPIGNRLYRYEFADDKLISPKLLLDLPYLPGPAHNGGVITIGPDNNVYVAVGELTPTGYAKGDYKFLSQNYVDGKEPDGRGGILRVTQDGQIVNGRGILGDEHPLDMYYAYGIRNSFGLAFDPVTDKLWDTENGGRNEINLVEPGFNSGYDQVSGMPYLDDDEFDVDNLVDFDGKGKYSDPKLDIVSHIAPTAIVFFDSDRYGKQFQNNMFVGTVSGEIFHFDLDRNRTELNLQGELADKVADPEEELDSVTFADDMGLITDLEVGPDGYLYATIYDEGKIVKIIPPSSLASDSNPDSNNKDAAVED